MSTKRTNAPEEIRAKNQKAKHGENERKTKLSSRGGAQQFK